MIINVWKKMFCCLYIQMTKYKITFLASLFNIGIKVIAMALVWKAVYAYNINDTQLSLDQMLVYSTISIALSQCLTWWDGPHYYALETVQSGTIIFDMLKPISFPVQLFIRGSSEFILNIIIYTIPTVVVGIIFLHISISIYLSNFFMFLVALIYSYFILFEFQLILSFISIKTLELSGIIHFFHAIVMLLSCQVIPIDMYPVYIQNIINVLPFKYVFYFPLEIISSGMPFDKMLSTMANGTVWLIFMGTICFVLWGKTKRVICIQGG